MCFTGDPGTGKTIVAMRMAEELETLGYVRKGRLVASDATTWPASSSAKTREVVKRAMGSVLFIDEACHLYKPENELDYGQESIEILLQAMENHRNDLVAFHAGYRDRMETSSRRTLDGFEDRPSHQLPDYSQGELMRIGG